MNRVLETTYEYTPQIGEAEAAFTSEGSEAGGELRIGVLTATVLATIPIRGIFTSSKRLWTARAGGRAQILGRWSDGTIQLKLRLEDAATNQESLGFQGRFPGWVCTEPTTLAEYDKLSRIGAHSTQIHGHEVASWTPPESRRDRRRGTLLATLFGVAFVCTVSLIGIIVSGTHRAVPVPTAPIPSSPDASVHATAQSVASSTAIVEETQQALVVGARVQAAVAATLASVPTATPVSATQTPVPVPQATIVVVTQPTAAPVYVPVPVPAPLSVGSAGLPQQGASPQADLTRAIQRANDAWAQADRTLDPSVLSRALAGKALQDDLAEIHALRAQGHIRNNVNTQFTVLKVQMESPQRAVVTTHEAWYTELFDLASGRLLQRTNAAEYYETYVIELQDGGWVVTDNEIQ